MYNDNTNSNFSVRNVIIQFLFVALFIFILMWLFPLKSDLNKALENCGGSECTDNSVLYDRIFNENVIAMKDAAKDYFTTERLPKNTDDVVKLTLGDMLDKKIILPFTDKNGDSCDLTESYVEVTKKDKEYVMKVNLKCGEQENYLLVYMGCYDYCSTLICEKNKSDVKTPVIYNPTTHKPVHNTTNNENKTPDINIDIDIDIDNSNTNNNNNNNNSTPTPEPTPTPNPQPETKEYLYEYVKETNGYYKESDWSEYSETPVSANATTAVRTKTVQKRKLVGYNVTTSYDKTKPIYANKVVTTGTEEIRVCDEYGYVTAGTSTGSEWVYQGLVTLYSAPTSTSTVKYEFVRFTDESCSNICTSSVGMIFRKYTKSTVDTSKYTCTKSSVKSITLTTTVKTITGYEEKVTKEPVYTYSTVKMYSYKTRTYVNGTKDIKWSVKNDTTLLSNGYSYTGNYKLK